MENYNRTFIRALSLLCLMMCTAYEASATDYCDPKLCDEDETHIACGNDGQFPDTCSGAKLIPIDKKAQHIMVEAHNQVRQEWASGQGKIARAACRMATIKWDDELASLAELNVKQCQMEHDACHNTKKYKYSGQNLYMSFGMQSIDLKKLLKDVVASWASEGNDATEDQLDAYPDGNIEPAIGHFTALTQETSIAVGCAIANYQSGYGNTFLVACNYARTNIIGAPVYRACAEAASECTSGTNPKYPALCSAKEKINPNAI